MAIYFFVFFFSAKNRHGKTLNYLYYFVFLYVLSLGVLKKCAIIKNKMLTSWYSLVIQVSYFPIYTHKNDMLLWYSGYPVVSILWKAYELEYPIVFRNCAANEKDSHNRVPPFFFLLFFYFFLVHLSCRINGKISDTTSRCHQYVSSIYNIQKRKNI